MDAASHLIQRPTATNLPSGWFVTQGTRYCSMYWVQLPSDFAHKLMHFLLLFHQWLLSLSLALALSVKHVCGDEWPTWAIKMCKRSKGQRQITNTLDESAIRGAQGFTSFIGGELRSTLTTCTSQVCVDGYNGPSNLAVCEGGGCTHTQTHTDKHSHTYSYIGQEFLALSLLEEH